MFPCSQYSSAGCSVPTNLPHIQAYQRAEHLRRQSHMMKIKTPRFTKNDAPKAKAIVLLNPATWSRQSATKMSASEQLVRGICQWTR